MASTNRRERSFPYTTAVSPWRSTRRCTHRSRAPSRNPSATGTVFKFPSSPMSLLNALCGTSKAMAHSDRANSLAPSPTRETSSAQSSEARQGHLKAHLISNRNSTQMTSQLATRLNCSMLSAANAR